MRMRLGGYFAYNWEPVTFKDKKRNVTTKEMGGFGISDAETYKGS
jgi:hypothetical protein